MSMDLKGWYIGSRPTKDSGPNWLDAPCENISDGVFGCNWSYVDEKYTFVKQCIIIHAFCGECAPGFIMDSASFYAKSEMAGEVIKSAWV